MKRHLTRITLVWAALLFCATASAQGIRDVRINEIQVFNTDGLEDDYGHRVGWIELFNAGYSQVDVGGAFLKVDGKEYRIPKNDPRTVIAPQGYVIFYAEGTASKGTFHTNFTLHETGWVEFYDQSGKGDPIYRMEYDREALRPVVTINPADSTVTHRDVTYGYFTDHDGVEKLMVLPAMTPLATNDTLERVPRDEHFRQADPLGVVMAITAMGVVFTALVLLYLIFRTIGKSNVRAAQRREAGRQKAQDAAAGKSAKAAAQAAVKSEGLAGDELAAIAVALYQYSEDLHDIENTVLTINRVAKAYSPWSSKIYGLRQLPNKK